MTHEEKFLNAVVRSSGAAWFESRHCKIWMKDRTKGLQTPRCNYLQMKIQRVIDEFEDRNLPVRILALKPRQRGSTTFLTAQGYALMRRISTSAVFIGGQSEQTVGLWNMIKTYKENDSFDWGNSGQVNEKGAEFSNGSRAKKETAKDVQAGIGDTYQLLHATEAARWSRYGVANASDVMTNILKAVPLLPKTYIFLETTAEGRSGDFYERWTGATDAEKFLEGTEAEFGSFVRVFAPWFEFEDSVIRLSSEQKREIQNSLDGDSEYEGEQALINAYAVTGDDGVQRLGNSVKDYDVWEQLAWRRYTIRTECKRDKLIFDRDYPHSWQTAFQQSGNQRFGMSGVKRLRDDLAQRVPVHGILDETRDKRVIFRKTEQNEAKFTIFERPTKGCKYLLSVDPMTGASQTTGEDPDFHGVFAMRAGYWDGAGRWVRPATVARIVPCRWDIAILEEAVWQLARFYGNGYSGCKIAVEVNMDRGIIELLKTRGADLYRREVFNRVDEKTSKAYGFMTTPKTRETLVETLSAAIRNWDEPGQGIDIFCPHAVEQCENFVRKTNGTSAAAEGYHDDDVLSIALGLQVIEHATTYVSPTPLAGWGEPPMRRPVGTSEAGGAYS